MDFAQRKKECNKEGLWELHPQDSPGFGFQSGPMIQAQSRYPEESVPFIKEGDPLALPGRNLAVDEEILHLLLPLHAKWLKAIARAAGADNQREIDAVGIEPGNFHWAVESVRRRRIS